MLDVRGDIQDYIQTRIRALLEDSLNEYQDPDWVQAAILFKQVVVPCETYMTEQLYDLAKDIVKKAEQNNNRILYQNISGMYNVEVSDLNPSDMNNLHNNIEIKNYTNTIDEIKKWTENFDKKR